MHAPAGPGTVAALTILERLIGQLLSNRAITVEEVRALINASAQEHEKSTYANAPETAKIIRELGNVLGLR